MVDHCVDHSHGVSLCRVVVAAEEEDLTGPFLTNLAGEISGSIAGVIRSDIGVGLLENCVLSRSESHVADNMETVPAAHRPARDDRNYDLGHKADEALDFEDVKAVARG